MKIKQLFFSLLLVAHTNYADGIHHTVSSNIDMGNDHHMHGMYGLYPMTREASGTSWEPDSTQLPSIMRELDTWSFMLFGYLYAIYDKQGGRRGCEKFFSENMFMMMALRDYHKTTLGIRTMFSLEPGTIGKCGYPLLLQTGETGNGRTPLIDRQHPHDLFMELAVTTHIQLSQNMTLFGYFGLPGEPALGPPVYMMRFSGIYNPEAPITHHWLDSTHIQFGVATIGFVWQSLKLDASVFSGREPDQHRWNFDRPRFDSFSFRCSVNPTENIALQISHSFLKSPEQLTPRVNTRRSTASCIFNFSTDTLFGQTTICWGRNHNSPGHTLNAMLIESAIAWCKKHIFFARAEYVAKDELFIPPDPRAGKVFHVGKFTAGYLFALKLNSFARSGLGFCISFAGIPHNLVSAYGKHPVSGMIYWHIELNEN